MKTIMSENGKYAEGKKYRIITDGQFAAPNPFMDL